jgi:putative solute:sodium symporter small subunit
LLEQQKSGAQGGRQVEIFRSGFVAREQNSNLRQNCSCLSFPPFRLNDGHPLSSGNNMKPSNSKRYWRANLKIVSILMTIWFLVAYGASIFGIEWLNQFKIGQLGLGFWMAQQGSIYVFVVLVFVYAIWMDWLDRKFSQGDQQ